MKVLNAAKKFFFFLRKDLNNNQVFFRLLMSYIFILLIPILTSWLAYSQAIRDAENYTKASTMLMLKQSSDIIDRHLYEVERAGIQIAMNPRLKEIVYAQKKDNYKLSLFVNEISSYSIPNDIVLRTGIFLKKGDYVIYSDTVYGKNFFYKNIFHYRDFDFNTWKQKYANVFGGEFWPSQNSYLERTNQKVITYLQSIPFNIQKRRSEGAIFCLLDVNEIHNLLPRIDVKNGGWVYIIDSNGNLMTSVGKAESLSHITFNQEEGFLETSYHGKPIFVTYATSPSTGWKYVVALPRATVMAKVHYIKILAVIVTIVSLISGCILSYFLAYKNALPIRGIVNMVSEFFGIEQDSKVGEYEFLSGKISELISNNALLKADIKQQSALATSLFFDRLLKGDFKNTDEVDVFSKYVGVDIYGKRFLAVVLKMYGISDLLNQDILKELDMTKVVIKDILKRVIKEDTFMYDLDENSIAILMMFGKEVDNCFIKAESLMNEIYYEVYSRYRVRLNFAAGDVVDNFTEISQSFEKARDCVGYFKQEKEKKILWYHDLPKQSEGYYYSLDLEIRIMNAVKAGDYSEVERYLTLIYEENYEKRTLSSEMIHLLTWEMRGTLIKLKAHIELSETILESLDKINNSTQPFEEFFEDIKCIYKDISNHVDNQKRSHNISLKNKMIEFINQAYKDASLSLSTVASKFSLTESYISQFFKEQTGENFSGYLEKVRMEHACDMLAKSDLPINEIAQSVGYYSDQVFRRAFKRFHGMTPNEFRMLSKSKDLEVI